MRWWREKEIVTVREKKLYTISQRFSLFLFRCCCFSMLEHMEYPIFSENQQKWDRVRNKESEKKVCCSVKICTWIELECLIRLHVICSMMYVRILIFHLNMQSGSVELPASRTNIFHESFFSRKFDIFVC